MAHRPKFAIGLEAIGMRHSVAVIANLEGNILSAVRMTGFPMTFHTTAREQLKSSMFKVLKALFGRLALRLSALEDSILCVGMTGVTFGFDRAVELPNLLLRDMDLQIGQLVCTGDVEIVYASHASFFPGAAIICHSGSTAYYVSQVNGKLEHVRFGGWGPVFGDDGSGYWIGRMALSAIAEEHDLHKPPSKLWSEIETWLTEPELTIPAIAFAKLEWERTCEKISGQDCPELDPRTFLFYCSHQLLQRAAAISHDSDGLELWRRFTSSLVTPVMRAAENGDDAAVSIIDKAASSLAHQIKMACTRGGAQKGKQFPIVLYGGVITHNPGFKTRLVKAVMKELGEQVEVITAAAPDTMRPALGALLYALSGSKTGELIAPSEPIRQRVLSSYSEGQFIDELKND